MNSPAQDILWCTICPNPLHAGQLLIQVLEGVAQFGKGIGKGVAILEKYPLAIPILSHGVYYPGNIRYSDSASGEQGQGIYFGLYVSDISNLKLRTIVGTESAGVIGAAAGQREKIAFPFTWWSDDVGSTEAHAPIISQPKYGTDSAIPFGTYFTIAYNSASTEYDVHNPLVRNVYRMTAHIA
jgi:hypothetical protein